MISEDCFTSKNARVEHYLHVSTSSRYVKWTVVSWQVDSDIRSVTPYRIRPNVDDSPFPGVICRSHMMTTSF